MKFAVFLRVAQLSVCATVCQVVQKLLTPSEIAFATVTYGIQAAWPLGMLDGTSGPFIVATLCHWSDGATRAGLLTGFYPRSMIQSLCGLAVASGRRSRAGRWQERTRGPSGRVDNGSRPEFADR